jgi:hypothetical protein
LEEEKKDKKDKKDKTIEKGQNYAIGSPIPSAKKDLDRHRQ